MYKTRKTVRVKYLASRRRVAKARAVAGLPRRRRGAQPGNDNRLIHGRYSRRFLARQAHIRSLLRDAATFIAEMNRARRTYSNHKPSWPVAPERSAGRTGYPLPRHVTELWSNCKRESH